MGLRRILAYCTFFLICSSSGWAQLANTTAILGNVVDGSGAPILDAAVSAVSAETKDTYNTVTNKDGFYTFQSIRIGTYGITVQKAGFGGITKKGVLVDANQVVRTDFTLQVGQLSQHVEVEASTPPISTDDASVKEIIGQKMIADLPLNGRDPLQLATTVPGVLPGQKGTKGVPPGEDFIGPGNREIQNSMSLDGISIVNNLITTTPFHPSVDSVAEMEVQTGTYGAQYGAYLGVHINLVTKGGGNQLHGALYEFLRNDKLNARPYFLAPTASKTPLKQNQFGFEIGGPIYIPKLYDGRNKSFFMVDYEGLRQVQSLASLATVFTEAERTGNFSDILSKTQLVYPGTTTPISGNLIPTASLSPQALKFLQWFPHPNLPILSNNLAAVYPNSDHWNQTIDRVDQNIGDKTRLFFRYSWINEAIFAGSASPFQSNTLPALTKNWVFGFTQTLSPTMVNDFRVGRNTLNTNDLNYWYTNNLKDAGTQLGIPGFTADTTTGNPGVPAVSITGYTGSGNGGSNWFQTDTTWQGTDTFTWTRGAHTLMAGAELRKLITGRQAVNSPLGGFNFSGGYSGNGAADFLLGVSSGDTTPAAQILNIVAEWRDGFFVTDNWHATRKLTVDLGLRYELPTVPFTVNGFATILNPAQTALIPATPPQRGFPLTGPNHKDFAPRVGLAYRITDKTVFRMGYGIYYNPNQTNSYTFLSVNPPFAYTAAYTATAPIVTFSNPTPASVVSSPSSTPTVYTPAFRMPTAYMNQWSADLQQGVWANGALDILYLGSHTSHLDRSYYNNTPLPGVGNIQLRRPNQAFGSIRTIQTDESSSYQQLAVTLRQRLSHGVTALVWYTWSHDLDAGSDSNNGGAPMNPYNWKGDYGNASQDVRHRFQASATYALPFLRTTPNRFLRTAVAGWQANGNFNVQSGFPFNVTFAADQANVGLGNQRPNLIGTPTASCGGGRLVNCISVSAFQFPSQYTYGNAGRNILTGPGFHNLDFSLFKDFAVSESVKVQFRSEFFNLFNTPQFGNPGNTTLPSLTAGNFSYTGVALGSFGNTTSTLHDNRQIQFALKLVF